MKDDWMLGAAMLVAVALAVVIWTIVVTQAGFPQ